MAFRALAGGSKTAAGQASAMPDLLLQEGVVRCSRCHRAGTLTAGGPFDAVADVAHWREMPCCFVPGCPGLVQPEPFN